MSPNEDMVVTDQSLAKVLKEGTLAVCAQCWSKYKAATPSLQPVLGWPLGGALLRWA